LLGHHRLNIKCLPSINSDDSRLSNPRLLADVLMAMKEQSRLNAANVTAKSLEAEMNLIISVVNVPRRIVGDENINRRKRSNQIRNLILLVKKVTSWLVSPRAVETAERKTTETLRPKMQVENGSGKRSNAVVISFDSEYARALRCLCRLQNELVCHITARNQNVRTLTGRCLRKPVIVGNDE
jgi:hypothetical protein